MNNNRWTIGILCVFAAMLLAFTGCNANHSKDAKDVTHSAIDKLIHTDSYTFHKEVQLKELSVKTEKSQVPAFLTAMLESLNQSEISFDGIYQKEPFRVEMTAKLKSYSGIPRTIVFPILMTADKTWFQITSSSLLPIPIPAEYIGKYVEIDNTNEMYFDGDPTFLAGSIMQFDDPSYYKRGNKFNIDLPTNVSVGQITTFSVKEEQLDEALMTLVKKVLPQLLEQMQANTLLKEEDRSAIDQTQRRMADVQMSDIVAWLERVRKSFKLNDFFVTSIIDKEGSLRYQQLNTNLAYLNGNDLFKLDMIASEQFDELNQPVRFQFEAPKDAIPFAEFAAKVVRP